MLTPGLWPTCGRIYSQLVQLTARKDRAINHYLLDHPLLLRPCLLREHKAEAISLCIALCLIPKKHCLAINFMSRDASTGIVLSAWNVFSNVDCPQFQ